MPDRDRSGPGSGRLAGLNGRRALFWGAAFGPAAALLLPEIGGAYWALLVLAGALRAPAVWRRHGAALRANPAWWTALALLAAYLLVAWSTALWLDASDFALSRLRRTLLWLGAPLIFLLLLDLGPPRRAVYRALALNAVVFGLWAVAWWAWTDGERVRGVTHAVHFGHAALFLAVAPLALWFERPGRPAARWAGLALAGGLPAVLLSGSRGAWLAAAVVAVFLLALAVRRWGLSRRRIAAAAVLLLVALMGLAQLPVVERRLAETAAELEAVETGAWTTSLGWRLWMWREAWALIRERPFTGAGFSSYYERVRAHVRAGLLPEEMLDFASEPHNDLLYHWVTRGLPGVLVYLLLLAWPAAQALRLLRGPPAAAGAGWALVCLVAVVALAGLTITVFDQRAVLRYLSWTAAGLGYALWTLRARTP
ncbi:MAG: hypothetical protein KatS3mg121_0693 [Gammaproteobacteria bacterium]|nr:MAG: hypothetical protein KatS3mg121_0693 [Gammaproteobacteria bacterium]